MHALVTLPLLVFLATRRNPFRHYRGMPSALVTAFSTCSTMVTLPLTMEAVTGTVFIPFHYAEGAANILTNAALDPVANIPEYKVCAVKVSKAA